MTRGLGGTDPAREGSDPPVDRCPWCEDAGLDVRGTVDWRITIGGRHVYRCSNDPDHRWQDANEKPSSKGAAVVVPSRNRP